MVMRTNLLVPLVLSIVVQLWTRTAHACDPSEYLTPFDLHDRAAVDANGTVRADVIETLKGSRATGIAITDRPGDCTAGFSVGVRGIAFVDGTGGVLGLYNGFVRDRVVIDALRRYATAATPADRAAPMLELAISRDWTRSYNAALALADRIDLVLALDDPQRDQLVARLAKASRQHPLIRVAARTGDRRVVIAHKRRGFTDVGGLASILAQTFAVETDTTRLAEVIERGARTSRIAALERCEYVWAHPLARFMTYTTDAADRATWTARANACRTGTPTP
jgi:hypothetical protein